MAKLPPTVNVAAAAEENSPLDTYPSLPTPKEPVTLRVEVPSLKT